MSFTCADAISLALTENWLDETLDESEVLVWGNWFLRRTVNDSLWQDADTDYENSVADTWYSLPTDFIRVVEIKDSNDMNYSDYSYTIKNGKIKFAADGSYTLTYVQYPTALASVASDVPLPDSYLYPMAEFMVFKFYNKDNDDKDRKEQAMEYESRYKGTLKEIYDRTEIRGETESFQVQMRW